MSLSTSLSALVLLCASLAVVAPQAQAQTSTTTKKTTKKAAKKPAAKAAPVEVDDGEDEGTPDIKTSVSVDYKCELGNSLTIYTNAEDDKHIALRWGKTLHRLTRVPTTTGANRFENRKYGLLWIGIPAKGILLDSKQGHQLANECKSPTQEEMPAPTPVDPANSL
ncbi:putative signal peptide protein [Collimonas arenae]|uniref:Putative signal peptide protein n=1 Tax=Collimonas arenae TaxID=279058 RepID=A0A0A1FBD7_9BURK|nr:putative signal peptide protein [Collimonas arenae]